MKPRSLFTVTAIPALALAVTLSAQTPAAPGGTVSGVFNVLDFGAKPDGLTDCTGAMQKAIDAAAVKGGVVMVPVGRWLCQGHLELKMGVHLSGINQAPQSWEPASGTILLPTEGRGREEAPAFIEMRSSTSIKGVTIYYPEQKVDAIRPYPWTIQIRAHPGESKDVSFDSTVENVTLINSYNGIRTGPTENGRHRLFQINGCVLRRGILVEGTGDIGRIENVQFHSHFWAHKAFEGNWDKVFSYMQTNLEAFVFGRTDWEYVNNTFVFPAKVGYRFMESRDGGDWSGACNGQFSGIGADACDTCVLVESLQPQGLLVSNGQFNSHRVGRATQVVVERTCRGNIRFVNCGFWGPVEHNATIFGPSFVSFTDCYFSNDYTTTNYAVVAEAGKLQVQNCTFDARSHQRKPGNAFDVADLRNQPGSIHLKPGIKQAIIRGNNGYYGVNIKNEAGEKAIITDNEPYLPAH
jgi:hypothetical protein